MTSYQWKSRRRDYQFEIPQLSRYEALTHPLRTKSVYSKRPAAPQPKPSSKQTSTADDPLAAVTGSAKKTASDSKEKKKDEPDFIDPLGATLDDPLNANGTDHYDQKENSAAKELGRGSGFDSFSATLRENQQNNSRKDFIDTGGGSLWNTLSSEQQGNNQQNSLDEDFDPENAALVRYPDGFEPWAAKRPKILSQFTTNEKLTIVTSFLPGGTPMEAKIAVSNQTQHRLEQLDVYGDKVDLRRLADLNQQEYINRINQLNTALLQAWKEDRRVDSVKIVIQSAKMLADTSVAAFYPSQFVLVTDILDTFGRLVFQRLWSKANEELAAEGKPPLSPRFSGVNVPEGTRETARNWFYKIASVRELLPRFYVEAALLRCSLFLGTTPEFRRQELVRLASMTRGMAKPLVSVYARCYICRVGVDINLNMRDHCWQALHDSVRIWSVNNGGGVGGGGGTTNNLRANVRLFWPPVEWLCQCLTYNAPSEDFLPLLSYAKQKDVQDLILAPILTAFPGHYISKNSIEIAKILLGSQESLPTQTASLLRHFGRALLISEPSPEIKRSLLREMWKTIMKFESVADYMLAGEVWLEFASRNFGPREVNTLLDDIIRHLNPDKQYEQYYPQLLGILEKVVMNMKNFQIVFGMDRFVAFLDLLQKDSIKVQACRTLLESFARYQQSVTDDLALSHHVMSLARTLHDSLNTLSLDDERRATVVLINRSVNKFQFTGEEELNFLVEARGAFSNLDPVICNLIHRVNSLIVRTQQTAKPTRKTAYFIRACVAYTYITIPSIVDPYVRLPLYIESSSVALMNNCVSQAESLLKAAISLLPNIPLSIPLTQHKSTDMQPILFNLMNNLLSIILLMPDPPQTTTPLFLLQGFITSLDRIPWSPDSAWPLRVQISVLVYLATAEQSEYPYGMEAVESNDTLYGGNQEFKSAVAELSQSTLKRVLESLKSAAESSNINRTPLILDLFNALLHHGDLADPGVQTLSTKLWSLAVKHRKLVGIERLTVCRTFVARRCEQDATTSIMPKTAKIAAMSMNQAELDGLRVVLNKMKL